GGWRSCRAARTRRARGSSWSGCTTRRSRSRSRSAISSRPSPTSCARPAAIDPPALRPPARGCYVRSMRDLESVNRARFRPGRGEGFYESFFQRANHPTRPLAFWIRYTLFSPAGRPEAAIGEKWAILFDGESGRHAVAKEELPVARCAFDREAFSVSIGDARLSRGGLRGAAGSGAGRIAWDLAFEGGEPPLLLLPAALYDAPLPRAKSLVGAPMAAFRG